MRKLVILAFAAVFIGSGVVSSATAKSALGPCAHTANHEFEVCAAYLVNSTAGALVPYYKYGRSTNQARANVALDRLESRYRGQARKLIERRVKSWPNGDADVALPHITITNVAVVLAVNKATLITRETWQVTDDYGEVIYSEVKQVHRITMQRVPGLLVHKWVVTSIR